jgi:hypothetical protein
LPNYYPKIATVNLTPQQIKYAQVIQRSGDDLQKLLAGLLGIAQIEENQGDKT